MNDALLIIGHGSRDAAGVAEFLELGVMLAERRAGRPTGMAFLEFARPTIEEGIERLVAAGARRIVCQPAMLFAAGHVKNDLPRELRAAVRRWPEVEFRMGRELDIHEKLLKLCRVRWDEAMLARLAGPSRPVPLPASGARGVGMREPLPLCKSSSHREAAMPRDTMLLLVGRGASDPDANAAVDSIAKILGDRYGVGAVAACFSGLATPLVTEALAEAARSGFRRIVVQPYLLFTGVLVRKIAAWTAECAAAHPELEVFTTSHLGPHELLADVFEERAAEAAAAPGQTIGTEPCCHRELFQTVSS